MGGGSTSQHGYRLGSCVTKPGPEDRHRGLRVFQRGMGMAVYRLLQAVLIGSALAGAFAVAPAAAKGTAAGTAISNTATVTFSDGGVPVTVTSNVVTFRVQEVLDVNVTPANGARIPVSLGDTGRAMGFRVTNLGNGTEKFKLKVRTDITGDMYDPTCRNIVFDTNNNGVYDALTDVVYVGGSNEPELAPDQAILVFAICDIPANLNNEDWGAVAVEASAATGTGTPGTVFPNKGTDGVDALVGSTTARSEAQNGFIVAVHVPTLTKRQQVTDLTGGTTPVAGATILYTLVAEISTGSGLNAIVSDPIPANTTFVAGSMRLDNEVLTDGQDADAGRFTGNAIEVRLGTLTAGTPRTVSFRVRINQP